MKYVVIVALVALAIFGWTEVYDRILPTEYIASSPDSGLVHEKDFDHRYLTATEISDYLRDTTMLLSSPQQDDLVLTSVIYLNADHTFVRWHSIDIHSGHWTTQSKIQRRVYRDRSRWVVVQLFCQWHPNEPELNVDNCQVAYDQSSLFQNDRLLEKVSGNPLGLDATKRAPFQLPSKQLTIQWLAERIKESISPK